jgi:CheY-like chemotaxis protein
MLDPALPPAPASEPLSRRRPAPPWAGRRVLVVEDEYIVAEDLRQDLERHGVTVLGPVPSVQRALALLDEDQQPDAAILDVNLGGEMGFPVADRLHERGVPVLLATGYDAWSIPERYARLPRCEKPFDAGHCLRMLFEVMDT